jgi:hypothetical protein
MHNLHSFACSNPIPVEVALWQSTPKTEKAMEVSQKKPQQSG